MEDIGEGVVFNSQTVVGYENTDECVITATPRWSNLLDFVSHRTFLVGAGRGLHASLALLTQESL